MLWKDIKAIASRKKQNSECWMNSSYYLITSNRASQMLELYRRRISRISEVRFVFCV